MMIGLIGCDQESDNTLSLHDDEDDFNIVESTGSTKKGVSYLITDFNEQGSPVMAQSKTCLPK